MRAILNGVRVRIETVEALIKKRPGVSQYDWSKVSTEVLRKIAYGGPEFNLLELAESEYEQVMSAKIKKEPNR